MARHIEVDSEAAAEAVSARKWYEARSSKAAAGFVAELEMAIDCIVESPLRYRAYVAGTRRYLMRRFPFFIVYQFEADADLILIVAVAHAKRRPDTGVVGEPREPRLERQLAATALDAVVTMQWKSEKAIKDHGKMRLEGKDYLLQDGDLCHFLIAN